jgi:2-hydroxy-6-oxonona-2,4-dienedioate hydrolase
MNSKITDEGEAVYGKAETALWDSVGLSPTERRIAFPGMNGTVRLQEVGDGRATVFIHGGPNGGSTWVPILPYLPAVRVILIDRPGTGLSDTVAIESISDLERFGDHFVASVLDALEIQRADIVASSFGGYLALRSAAATPDRIGRMVQMACPAGAPGMLTPPFMRAMSLKPVRRILGMLPYNQKASDAILRHIGHGKTLDGGGFPQVFNDWYTALMVHTDTNYNDGELIGKVATLRGFVPEFTLVPTLPKVETPTLFLWGADDGFGREEVARDTVAAMPNAQLEMIQDAGHLPWLDFPEPMGRKTAEFLSG